MTNNFSALKTSGTSAAVHLHVLCAAFIRTWLTEPFNTSTLELIVGVGLGYMYMYYNININFCFEVISIYRHVCIIHIFNHPSITDYIYAVSDCRLHVVVLGELFRIAPGHYLNTVYNLFSISLLILHCVSCHSNH